MLLTIDDHLPSCPTQSCVYLIRCGDFHKIGRANNPVKRLGLLQVGCPYELRLAEVFYTPHATDLEVALHQQYAAYRVRGEWFALPKTYSETLVTWPDDFNETALWSYMLVSGYPPANRPPWLQMLVVDWLQAHADGTWIKIPPEGVMQIVAMRRAQVTP